MKKIIILFCISIFASIFLLLSCKKADEGIAYKKWVVREPILTAGPKGMFDDVAVKDPSMVFFNGKYHLFYTSKTVKDVSIGIKYITGIGYVSASTITDLNNAKRYDINAMVGDVIIAPQIFYFEPHKLWYLIAQTRVTDKRHLAPMYMTNPDIEDGEGWSKPTIILEKRLNGQNWIDFWVICDEYNAYLFYTDQKGSLYNMQTPLKQFPMGFENAVEVKVYFDSGENNIGEWKLYNACHIYYVKSTNKYFAVVEGAYPHPTNSFYYDARNRFQLAIQADSLNGAWSRVEISKNDFFCDPANIFYKNGERAKYTQISHVELIRSGYNQKMEIEDYHFRLMFQGFDGTKIPDSRNYNEVPWEISIIENDQ
jgi:endo-1,4-beta-xylanase